MIHDLPLRPPLVDVWLKAARFSCLPPWRKKHCRQAVCIFGECYFLPRRFQSRGHPLTELTTKENSRLNRSTSFITSSIGHRSGLQPMPSEVSLNYPMGKFIHIFRLPSAISTARTFDLVWGCYFDISPPRHSPCFQQIHPLSIPACKWDRFIFRLLLFQKPGCHIYNSKARHSRLGRHSYATPLVLAGFSL